MYVIMFILLFHPPILSFKPYISFVRFLVHLGRFDNNLDLDFGFGLRIHFQ